METTSTPLPRGSFPGKKVEADGTVVIREEADVIRLVQLGVLPADAEQMLGGLTVSQLAAHFRIESAVEAGGNDSSMGV